MPLERVCFDADPVGLGSEDVSGREAGNGYRHSEAAAACEQKTREESAAQRHGQRVSPWNSRCHDSMVFRDISDRDILARSLVPYHGVEAQEKT